MALSPLATPQPPSPANCSMARSYREAIPSVSSRKVSDRARCDLAPAETGVPASPLCPDAVLLFARQTLVMREPISPLITKQGFPGVPNGGAGSLCSVLVLLLAAITISSSVSATTGHLSIAADTTLTEQHNGTISFTADGVILDCAGHLVMGPGSGIGITISGRTGVTVKNCLVMRFQRGFFLNGSSGNTLTDNAAWGLGNSTGRGFVLNDSSGNTLQRNQAFNHLGEGFRLDLSSPRNILQGNIAYGRQHGRIW